jgi:ATPase subunit of ABC transporter with duplicated ATPase domains
MKNFYASYIELLQQAYATEQQRIQEKLLATKLLHSDYSYIGRETLLSRSLSTDSKRKVKATFVGAPGIGKNTLIFKIANDKYIPSLGWMPYVVNCVGTQNYSRRQAFEEFRDKDENTIQLWGKNYEIQTKCCRYTRT